MFPRIPMRQESTDNSGEEDMNLFPPFAYLCGGDVADVLRCQLLEQGGLPSVVQTQQQYPHLLVWCAL